MEENYLIQDIERAEINRMAREIRHHKEPKPLWREYLETSIIALLAAILLRVFVVSAYRVNSASMENSLLEGDYIFVNKLAFEFGKQPQAGDIIVFEYPANPTKDYIKRVVALPGQTVEIVDKAVYVNGQAAQIPTLSKHVDPKVLPADLSFRDNFGPFVVPEGEYFVLGDNRDDSRDSRFWGTVPTQNIRGKAVFTYWSWQPDPDARKWGFPYVIDAVRGMGRVIYNFPTHVRWDRLAMAL